VQRVVAVFGSEADFDIVVRTSVASQNVTNLSAEIAFDFENESADATFRIVRVKGENLFGERYMQLAVFPEPTAPTMAMPVNKPRSGSSASVGSRKGLLSRMMDFPRTRLSSARCRGSG